MLFLLNDVVFDLDEACPVTPGDARRFDVSNALTMTVPARVSPLRATVAKAPASSARRIRAETHRSVERSNSLTLIGNRTGTRDA